MIDTFGSISAKILMGIPCACGDSSYFYLYFLVCQMNSFSEFVITWGKD